MNTTSLDIGCGENPRNLFGASLVFGIDIKSFPENNVIGVDLALEKIPFGEDFFDFVVAFHILEHIPRVIYVPTRRQPFIEVMNEIWRVLKPGGKLLSVTSAFPNPQAFQDPTHVNFITDKTFSEYFCEPNGSGFSGRFEIEKQGWHDYSLATLMKKLTIKKTT
jgi:SAM-dependent methyltransferase